MRRTIEIVHYVSVCRVEPSSIFIAYLAPTYRAAEKSAREKVTSTKK